MQQIHLKFLLPYLRPYRWSLTLGLFFVVVSTALEQVPPYVLSLVVDTLHQGASWRNIIPYLILLLACTLLGAVLLYFQRWLVISSSRKAEYTLRNELFSKLQEQKPVFFNEFRIGDLMTRCTSDLDNVRELMGPVLLHSGRMFLLFIYTAAMMIWLSPILALVALGSAILLPFISKSFLRWMYEIHRSNQVYLSKLNNMAQETLNSISLIKSFGIEEQMSQRLIAGSMEFRNTSRRAAKMTSMVWPFITLVSGLGTCATIALGIYLCAEHSLTVGALAASLLYLIRVHFPLVGLGWVLSVFQKGRASLDRILFLVNKTDEMSEEPSRVDVLPPFQSIELKQISILRGEQVCLSGLNLYLSPGRQIGIVGPVGSGKTLTALALSSMTDLSSGQILLNGQEVTEQMSWRDYRRYFALAPQEGFLFSESIRYNIEFGNRQIDQEKTLQAAFAAGLERDLGELPDGLETLLGEKGVNLSGGQKQRVGLARALRSEAPVLILDDTLSALDTETEAFVLAQLKPWLAQRAALIVTHRYSAVQHCDEIIYLEEGQVVERGNHVDLMALGGRYATIWNLQQLENSHD